ncbi:hypothetical protein [Lentzea sp. NPDC004782]|uniref:hypothetical protein n=1 Tax=Lentzea sp. NPDC004782 TaxID=3154458 RepID=UPI0033A8BE8D
MRSLGLRPPSRPGAVVPVSRHRREQARPGCLRGLLSLPGVVVRLTWSKLTRR